MVLILPQLVIDCFIWAVNFYSFDFFGYLRQTLSLKVSKTWNTNVKEALNKCLPIFSCFPNCHGLQHAGQGTCNKRLSFIDGLLFQCFELPCACTYFFAVKTLRFTCLSIKLLCDWNTITTQMYTDTGTLVWQLTLCYERQSWW